MKTQRRHHLREAREAEPAGGRLVGERLRKLHERRQAAGAQLRQQRAREVAVHHQRGLLLKPLPRQGRYALTSLEIANR